MGAASAHEVAAFSRDLDRAARSAAEQAYVICSNLRGLLLSVSALGILTAADATAAGDPIASGYPITARGRAAADGRAAAHRRTSGAILERLADVQRRLGAFDGLDRSQMAALSAAVADLERAVRGVAEAGRAGGVTPWRSLTDCYAAMEQLRGSLWAFELRPEGAPLSAAARARYDEGFVSGASSPA